MQSRISSRVTPVSIEQVRSLNRIIEMYNSVYSLKYRESEKETYVGNGTIFIITPYVGDIIEKINVGNILGLFEYIEWLTVACSNSKGFIFKPRITMTALPLLNEKTVSNLSILEVLSDLLLIISKDECNEKI